MDMTYVSSLIILIQYNIEHIPVNWNSIIIYKYTYNLY